MLFFSSFVFCPVLRPAIPRCSFTSADIPSLSSLNSAICPSHLQQEKRLGCTSFHFELCFLRASLHHCRPPVLKAITVRVSVPDLAMYPAHRCQKQSLFWSMSNLSKTESPSDVFLSTILSILCVPLSSILLCLRHFLLSMTCVCSCHVFAGCRTAGHHDRLGHTDFSTASIHFPHRKHWVGPGSSTFSCMSCFFPHNILCCTTGAELPVINISTKANFSLHCSISLPARNLDTSCFCVELQFVYMVNVLSKSKPGHGRETTAKQQHCPRKSSSKTGLASNWDSDRSRRAWTSVALLGRTPSHRSPQPSPCLPAVRVHPLSAPQHRGLAPGEGGGRGETALPRHYPLES